MIDDDPRIDPDDLRNARFPGSSRRYDARAVDQFLETIAGRIAATNALVDDLTQQLDEVRTEAAAAPAPREVPALDALGEEELVRLIGEETTTVLAAARRAAEDIRSKAEESAARVIREATDEAKRTVDAAKDEVVELTSEAERARDDAVAAADAEADRIRGDAERDAHRVLAEAREEAQERFEEVEARRVEVEDEAARVLVEAREEGRSMVAEAKEVRARILADLQRRRDAARDQIERLQAGREQLRAVYALVREHLDEVTRHLGDAPSDEAGDRADELPDGFVGVVGGLGAETSVVEDDGGGPDDERDDGAAETGFVDDTVAPSVDAAVAEDDDRGRSDQAEEPSEAVDSDRLTDRERPADTVASDSHGQPDETHDHDGTATVGDDAAGPDATDSGPTDVVGEGATDVDATDVDATDVDATDVDALFARLRAERARSVARAHEVLDDDTATTDPSDDVEADAAAQVDDGGQPDGGEQAVPAGEQPDTAETPTAAEVEQVPAEHLAPSAALEARAEAIEALDTALARRCKRHLADEQNEVLDLLRRTGTATIEDLLADVHAHVAGYARLAESDLAAAGAAGARTVDAAAEAPDVTELAIELGTAIVEPFRRRIERSITEVGGDPDELDERLRALYREWKVQHLGPAVEDALLSAYALGVHAAAESGARLRWTIDPGQGPCPDAQDNALAGAVAKGERFPTGDACPQSHPGCRCLLVVDPG